MTFEEAKEAMKNHKLVGVSNVQGKTFCLYLTGYLVKIVKVRLERKRGFLFGGKKEKHFLFRDRAGYIETTRPASEFNFA